MQQLIQMFIFTALCNLVAAAWLLAVRRLVPQEPLKQANDAAAAYFSVIGTMYAVLLGFMLVECWDRYGQVESGVQIESAQLAQMYRLADSMPGPVQAPLRGAVLEYAHAVVEADWPAMRHGHMSVAGIQTYDQLWKLVDSIRSQAGLDSVMYGHLTDDIVGLTQSRHIRELKMTSTLPPMLWAVLIGGAIITISFSCMLGVDRVRLHLLKLAALTTITCMVLFAIAEIDGPFSGSLSINAQPFTLLIYKIEQHPTNE